MEAEEARRQAALAAQARARLEAARLAAQQASQGPGAVPDADRVRDYGDDVSISAPPPDGRASAVIGIAMQYLGVPWSVWGGYEPVRVRLPGLVAYAYAQIGVPLPAPCGVAKVRRAGLRGDQLQPADLVFFQRARPHGDVHRGGQFIHAPHTGDVVKISSIYESWYASTWVGARRIL